MQLIAKAPRIWYSAGKGLRKGEANTETPNIQQKHELPKSTQKDVTTARVVLRGMEWSAFYQNVVRWMQRNIDMEYGMMK